MPRSRAPYPPVLRQQMIDLVHKGASGLLSRWPGLHLLWRRYYA